MEVGIIDNITKLETIADVAHRAAQDQREREDVAQPVFAHHPDRHHHRDPGRQRDQRPAHGVAGGGQQAERDPIVLDIAQVEKWDDLHDIADAVDAKRAGDPPL